MSRFDDLRHEADELRQRLAEAEDALAAIRNGQVDAIVVDSGGAPQIFSLTGAERIYRVLVETMREAGLTLSFAGTILFCNERFCELMKASAEDVLGRTIEGFVVPEDRGELLRLLLEAQAGPVQRRVVLQAADGTEVPVQAAAHLLEAGGNPSICLVAADLTDLEASQRDITRLRDHQREMEKAQREILASRAAALNLMEDAIMARQEAERAEEALRESEEEYRALGQRERTTLSAAAGYR